jgi:hypothetical protein
MQPMMPKESKKSTGALGLLKNGRGKEVLPLAPLEAEHYKIRSTEEPAQSPERRF